MEQIRGRVLALDFGSRRIGVAVSDPLGITAQQLPAIRREGDRKDIEAIAVMAKEYGVETVVIGLPLLPGGTEGTQAARARAFARKLHERLGLPVVPWDERFTTAQAERHLIEAGVRREKRKEVRDSLAAALLLQSALDARNRK
jgi:putative Holliday junction resolvase